MESEHLSTLPRPLAKPTPAVTSLAGEKVGYARLLRIVAGVALTFGIPTALVGFATDDPLQLALSAGFLGSAVVLNDASRATRGGISPITLYAFSFALASFANLIGILNQDSPARSVYFLYALDEHLPIAMKVSWLGLVLPVLGFKTILASNGLRAFATLLPSVHVELPDRFLLPVSVSAAVFGFAAGMVPTLRTLGTLYAVVALLPHLAVFVLARAGVARKRALWVWIAFVIALVVATRAALFAYLRSDVIAPIFAYAAGVLIGAQSFRVLRSLYFAPVYVCGLVFVAYFAAFGEVRSRTSLGIERLTVVDEARVDRERQGAESYRSLIARLSNFNQLTQVARVVQEDGLYQGETLNYLAYAWIPRFIWPEKPLIAKGAWFAHRIGQAHIANGRISNSVNMTIPGELFLNYAWTGVVVGLLVYGALLASLWLTTRFWSRPNNVLGAAFGFYLLWTGINGGADLQIIVTLIATYLVFLAASSGLRGFMPIRTGRPAEAASWHLSGKDTIARKNPS